MESVTVFMVAKQDETLENVKDRLASQTLTSTQIVPGAEGEPVELTTAIKNVSERPLGMGAAISGIIRYEIKEDDVDMDGIRKTVVKTRTVVFAFIPGSVRLLVFKGKTEARTVAAKISRLVYSQEDDPVITCRIHPHDLDEFINRYNPEVRSCAWKELSIPAITRAQLKGPGVDADSSYIRYDTHGEKDSVLLRLTDIDRTVGINSAASVQFYNRLDISEKVSFLQQYILDMCR